MNPPRVLFLTDSLGMPRLRPEPVHDDEVWSNVVSRRLKDRGHFYSYNAAGLHTTMIVANLQNILGGFRPEVIVLQVGIVDCAPKALKELEFKIVVNSPGPLRRAVHRFLSRHHARITRMRDISYVTRERFRTNLQTMRRHFEKVAWVVLPIGAPNAAYKSKSPLIERNVSDFNAILSEVFGPAVLARMFENADVETLYSSDHHHLSRAGHALTAADVTTALEHLLTEGPGESCPA